VNIIFVAVFIRGLTGSITKLLIYVVRGLPIALHAGDEIVSGPQLIVRGVTKAEDVGFTTRVKAVFEKVRGVCGFMERGIVDGHFLEWQSVVPVVAVEAGSAKKLLHGLVGTLREAIALGMVRGGDHVTNAGFGAKHLPPVTGEARIAIRYDAPLEAMQAKMFQNITSAVSFPLSNLQVGMKWWADKNNIRDNLLHVVERVLACHQIKVPRTTTSAKNTGMALS